MSTTILLSGQLRTFSQCYPTQKWQVYRHYPDCHFFFVVQNNEQVNSLAQIQKDYPGRVHVKLIDDPKDLPEIPYDAGRYAPYANAAPHGRLMLQHWYQNEVWKFYKEMRAAWEARAEQEAFCDPQFDTFIRMRPDNWMQSIGPVESGVGVLSPWWGRFGGINDRMAFMSSEAAPVYFSLYNSIPSLLQDGCPFHPESLLLAHLEKSGIKVNHTLNAMFSTLRLPKPDPKDPTRLIQEMRFPEIQSHEIAEYARSR